MAKIFDFSTIEKKKREATKNFIYDKMTGRVYKVWRIFEKIFKKLKLKSQDPQKSFPVIFTKNDFFRCCNFILYFFSNFF